MKTDNLTAKLARILGEIGALKPEGRNTFHGYDYITEGQLSAALKSKLSDAGIFLLSSVDDIKSERVTNQKGNEENLVTVRTTHTFIADNGERFEIKGVGQGTDPGDKAVYKAITGSLKYVLMKNFLISDHSDPEGDEGVDQRSSGKQKHSPYREEERKQTPAIAADLKMLRDWLEENGIPEEFVIELAKEGKLSSKETSLDEFKAGTLSRLLAWRERIKERWEVAQAKAETTVIRKRPARDESGFRTSTGEKNVTGEVRTNEGDQTRHDHREFCIGGSPVDHLEQEGEVWPDVRITFGKLGKANNGSGTRLGDMSKKDLKWWIENYKAEQFRGKWQPDTVLLDAALCVAQQEMNTEGRVY